MATARIPRLLAGWLVAVVVTTLPACGETPTEFSPLVRAVGEVHSMALRFQGLERLSSADGIYQAWAILERNQFASLGRFNVNEAGQPVDGEGNVIEEFRNEDRNLINAVGALVTIEPPNDSDANPSVFRLLQGPFNDGVAEMTVPAPPEIDTAAGAYRIFTPTDGPNTNEGSGLWAIDTGGSPLLTVPDTTQALTYEGFVVLDGRPLTMAQFTDADEADANNPFSGSEPAPQVPGEDFLQNAPSGVQFPADLSGARVIVTLEPVANDAANPSQLVVLEGFVPAGVQVGEIVDLSNRSAEFPTGTAVVF